MREQTGVVLLVLLVLRPLREVYSKKFWNFAHEISRDNQFDPWEKQELDTRLIRRLQRDATFSFEIRSIWSTTWT